MSKKHTIGFVRAQFEKEGYTLTSKEYVNNKTPLDYICPEGDKGCISWNGWCTGNRCLECSGLKKLTIGFVREKFRNEGYILVSDNYVNSITPLKYICPKEHVGEITWCSWKAGCRCLECSGKKRLTIEFIRNEFKNDDYTLLSNTYTNSKEVLEYICPEGHKGSITWNGWQSGNRCDECRFLKFKGNSNPNWNIDLTNEDRLNRRYIFGYKEWTYAVKDEYNFTCVVCGDNKGGDLVSHHLESYNNNPELRTLLSNGVCLCETCHKDFHHQYGYGNNTKEQFEKFLLRRTLCE